MAPMFGNAVSIAILVVCIVLMLRTIAGPRWLLGCLALELVTCAGRAYVAPYAVLASFVPLAFLVWRRNVR